MKISIAESALNRLLNFVDGLDAPAMPAEQGAALDAAIAQPPGEMPALEGVDAALVAKGLNLAPDH